MHTFIIEDDTGVPHQYVLVKHAAAAALPVMRRIYPVAAKVITALLSGQKDLAGVVEEAGKLSAAERAAKFSALLPALMELVPELSSALFDEALLIPLLSHAKRDGEALDLAGFNRAFSGNYGELFMLVWEVVTYNGFFPLGRIGKAGKKPAIPTALHHG